MKQIKPFNIQDYTKLWGPKMGYDNQFFLPSVKGLGIRYPHNRKIRLLVTDHISTTFPSAS